MLCFNALYISSFAIGTLLLVTCGVQLRARRGLVRCPCTLSLVSRHARSQWESKFRPRARAGFCWWEAWDQLNCGLL